MTWTFERIEAVEAFAAELRPMQGAGTDLLALAAIGLAVVKADPETVERVGRAIQTAAHWSMQENEARAALAALREMGNTTPPR